jgi:hypothetical protein
MLVLRVSLARRFATYRAQARDNAKMFPLIPAYENGQNEVLVRRERAKKYNDFKCRTFAVRQDAACRTALPT